MSKEATFDFEKIDDFDNHINLSIPNFNTLDTIYKHITHQYAEPESIVLDIGCSTGRFLDNLYKRDQVEYIGCDSVDFKNRKKSFNFYHKDVVSTMQELKIKNISVIVSMFVLQFLGAKKRKKVIDMMKFHVSNGAIVLISEKVFLNNTKIDNLIHRLHIQEKRKGFTDTEILDKDEQLALSMLCKSENDIRKELESIGNVTKVWQSFNFMGFVVS